MSNFKNFYLKHADTFGRLYLGIAAVSFGCFCYELKKYLLDQ